MRSQTPRSPDDRLDPPRADLPSAGGQPGTPAPDRTPLPVIVRTEQEPRAQIAGIVRRFPSLADYAPDCDCGSVWCGSGGLSDHERAAYDELDRLRWLLGDPKPGGLPGA